VLDEVVNGDEPESGVISGNVQSKRLCKGLNTVFVPANGVDVNPKPLPSVIMASTLWISGNDM
jgi:hypothetical protein